MADEQSIVMADEGDLTKSEQSMVSRLPDLCSSMADMGYGLQQQTADALHPHHHKANDVWEAGAQTGPVHTHQGGAHPQNQVTREQMSHNEYYPMSSLMPPASKVPCDSQFQAWFSPHMLSAYGLQDKMNPNKTVYMTHQAVKTGNNQPQYKSPTPSQIDASHMTFRQDTPPGSTESSHVALQSQTPGGPDAGVVSYRCNTPDLLMSVMQLENQAATSRGSSQWCTPANSPTSSPWPSPGSQQQDSDYYSEEPSPQYYCQPHNSEPCPETRVKIPSFIPTFLPHNNSWNWLMQNTTNQKRAEPIRDLNPPKIQRLVKGHLGSRPSPTNFVMKHEPVATSSAYSMPTLGGLQPPGQQMLQSTHTSPSNSPSVCSSTTVLPTQFETRSSKPCIQGQKRSRASPPKCSKDLSTLPKKKSRHNEPLNNKAVMVMMRWYEEHWENPYPTKNQKDQLAKDGGISVTQVKSWFANKRNRTNNTRPKVQKKQMEDKLMDLCQTLSKDAKQPGANNAYIIDQLSSIINSRKCSAPSSVQCRY